MFNLNRYNKMFNVVLKISVKLSFKSRAREIRQSFSYMRVGAGYGEEILEKRNKDRVYSDSKLWIFSNSLHIYFNNLLFYLI